MHRSVIEQTQNAPKLSGIYKMYNAQGQIIYIGKAKNLHSRLNSYTKAKDLNPKTFVLVQAIANIEFEITPSEAEALILEASLVKKHQPKYNILLKDDKSRLYIKINKNTPFPAIGKYRGKVESKMHLFGPFGYIQGSEMSTNDIIKNLILFINKVFKIRSCKDSKFNSHKSMGRPCMEYQIQTCSGPCAALISPENYTKSVQNAVRFLHGNYPSIEKEIKNKIQELAKEERFSEAGALKNQIMAIEKLRLASQNVNFASYNNVDIIVLDDTTLQKVEVFSIRNGYAVGGSIFEISPTGENLSEIISCFIFQHYSPSSPPPKEIIASNLEDLPTHKAALETLFKTPIKITSPTKGDGKKLIDFVKANLNNQKIKQETQEEEGEKVFFEGMQNIQKQLNLPFIPNRIEVYDNSHFAGKDFLGAFIVATQSGFEPSSYRKFNAKTAKDGDDYGMMKEVITRRFTGSLTKKEDLPSLLLIDGGLGQFNTVISTLKELGISIPVCAIAKGRHRNSGNETFFTEEKPNGFKMPCKKTLLFLERIRDESHRFVITSHRKKRGW